MWKFSSSSLKRWKQWGHFFDISFFISLEFKSSCSFWAFLRAWWVFNTDITLFFYHFIFEKHLLSIHYLFFPNCTKKNLLHSYLQQILGFESMVRVLGLFAVETYEGNIFAKCESIYSVKKYCFGNQVIILNSSNTFLNNCVVYFL